VVVLAFVDSGENPAFVLVDASAGQFDFLAYVACLEWFLRLRHRLRQIIIVEFAVLTYR
jgi:hypothetical protein